MVFLWILSCFAFAGAAYGCGTPAIPPDISGYSDIVNGREAVPHSWPWQVSLQDSDGRHFCGGSLINESWVVTAAHCDIRFSDLVVLGAHDLSSFTEKVQVMKVDKLFQHPSYNCPSRYNNDIQLIKLARPARMNRHVSPVCVAETGDNVPTGIICMATGWGRVSGNGPKPDRLQQAALRPQPNEQCHRFGTITSEMICVGGNGSCACSGDSGGPLVCQKAGAWTLVGITSFGFEGCNPKDPRVNARVTALRAWMDRTIAAN